MRKIREKAAKSVKGISIRGGLLVIFVAAATLAATTFLQIYYANKGIRQEASQHAASELSEARAQIMDIVNQAEAAVRNNIWISRICLNTPDTLARIPALVVQGNPVVTGSTVALVPGYNKRFPLFSPYVVRDTTLAEGIRSLSLATAEYDYPSQEWFYVSMTDPDGYWSEPYFDEGGGDLLMTTFSFPVTDDKGDVAAILTADISLEWLTNVVSMMQFYPNAVSTIVSRAGNTLVTAGTPVDKKEKCHTYTGEVDRTGWSMSITIPQKDLMADVRRVGIAVIMFSLLGLLMLAIILRIVTRSLHNYQKTNELKERMQSELRIGHDIQMSMVPKVFPPFPERNDLDFAAYIVPAKEVGGDLYDYYIRDNKLFFCIGDVSGKGVPASLVMTVTCTLFRAVSSHEDSPARIVFSMNNSLSRNNENNMFVTFFLGVLDLESGELRYCNAGHNAPLILTNAIRSLQVLPNLPLGLMQGFEFQEQSVVMHHDDALFLYTDGLTEAENASAELFGEERMGKVLHTRRTSFDHLKAMQEAVNEFVGNAPQSDDLTMLFIHYIPGAKA